MRLWQQTERRRVTTGGRRMILLLAVGGLVLAAWLILGQQNRALTIPEPLDVANPVSTPAAPLTTPDQRVTVEHAGQARLAALRARCEPGHGDPIPELVRTLVSESADQRTREFCFDRLAPECARDSRAREGMISYLRQYREDDIRRSAAFQRVLHWGDAKQVERCLVLVHGESKPDVVLAALRGLRASPDPAIRQKASSLHWRHPDAKVRQRLRTLGQDKRP